MCLLMCDEMLKDEIQKMTIEELYEIRGLAYDRIKKLKNIKKIPIDAEKVS